MSRSVVVTVSRTAPNALKALTPCLERLLYPANGLNSSTIARNAHTQLWLCAPWGWGPWQGIRPQVLQGGSGRGTEHPGTLATSHGCRQIEMSIPERSIRQQHSLLGARRWGRGVRGKEPGICSPGPSGARSWRTVAFPAPVGNLHPSVCCC